MRNVSGHTVSGKDPSVPAKKDGLTHSEYLQLSKTQGRNHTKRCRGTERLAVGWLEHMTKAELDAYPEIVEITYAMISEAFSSRVIHPGVTTTDDVVWWMRQTHLYLVS